MTIFLTNLKRLLKKDILTVLFIIVFPVAIMSVVLSMSSAYQMLNVGIVDEDMTPLTDMIIQKLREKCNVKILDRSDIKYEIADVSVDTVFVFEKGFTDNLINGKSPQILNYAIQETNVSEPVSMSVNSFVNAAESIAKAVKSDESKFYETLSKYAGGKTTPTFKKIENVKGELELSSISLGFLVMSMLFLGSMAPSILIKDKVNRTVYRVISAPISVKNYMIQNILSFFVVSLIQIALLFTLIVHVFKMNLGPKPFNLVVATIFFSLVCVSFGTAINSYSRDLRQSGVISSLILTPMCMLGGCWWPMDIMPRFLQQIANFVPTTWIMKTYSDLLAGKNLIAVADKLAVILAFSVVFFLAASWKKTDIAQ